MTTEENDMFEKCKTEYTLMLNRIETVIRDKWPETLSDNGGVWVWLDEHKPDMRRQLRDVTSRLNVAWLNGILAEVKELTLEWGRLQLEIFKGYASYLKEQAQ
jgi:hypothetical protein